MKKMLRFFDKLEDIVRGTLSRLPILYAFVAGLGMVLFGAVRGIHLMPSPSSFLILPGVTTP